MTLQELTNKVRKELDSRNLATNRRYRALDCVISYIKEYHSDSISVLRNPKSEFKRIYEDYKKSKGQCFNQAESSAINEIYNQLKTSTDNLCDSTCTQEKEGTKAITINEDTNALMELQNFEKVSDLTENRIPDVPGLYAIRIKDINSLPHPFSDELQKREHDLLYIGKAKSLRKRLWRQELNHKSAATFFRSIGAILGFRPVKGSLSDKDTSNYVFSTEDTNKIKEWMKENLLVNIIIQNVSLEAAEKELILQYRPIINIKENPYKMQELSVLREECLNIAKEI